MSGIGSVGKGLAALLLVGAALVCVFLSSASAATEAPEPVEFETRGVNLQYDATRVWTAVFSPDGRLLATASGWNARNEPGEMVIWDLKTRKEKLISASRWGRVALRFRRTALCWRLRRAASCGCGMWHRAICWFLCRGTLTRFSLLRSLQTARR